MVETRSASKKNSNGLDANRKISETTMKKYEKHQELKKNREGISLIRAPLTCMKYFFCQLFRTLHTYSLKLLKLEILSFLLLLSAFFILLYQTEGFHQQYLKKFENNVFWCAYWIGLGVLSSIGLGTGLHTFLLYLGPHIASVTLAAYECQSVDFPEPPYPDSIQCPIEEGLSGEMGFFSIWQKVWVEAFMWGVGTAIGELPPYFIARQARLSGKESEEFKEIEEILKADKDENQTISTMDKAKLYVEKIIVGAGFFGILACASIPNPLFDLAGITCGHFLIPFWQFFGATVIGKAVIKMSIQKIFVIFLFSEHHVENIVSLLKTVPHVGPIIYGPFSEFLSKQKIKLHRKPGDTLDGDQTSQSVLQILFGYLVVLMVAYFLLSIVQSFAQDYHDYLIECEEEEKKAAKKSKPARNPSPVRKAKMEKKVSTTSIKSTGDKKKNKPSETKKAK